MKFYVTVASVLFFTAFSTSAEEYDIPEARRLIAEHLEEIRDLVRYSAEDLENIKKEYQGEYWESIEPRLDDIPSLIFDSAIHWIDIDPDNGRPELLFWTEGVAPHTSGPNEYLFVIRYGDDNTSEIAKARKLDPTPSRGGAGEGYYYVRFRKYPNRGRGYNRHVKAVMSYMLLGGSGATIYHLVIGWNRYERDIYISDFTTPFPIEIEKIE